MFDEFSIIARGYATRHAQQKAWVYDEHIAHEIDRWKTTEDEYEFLRRIFFEPNIFGRLPMSNTHVRWAAIEALISVFMADWDRDWHTPRWFVTFCLDQGATWFRQPVLDLVGHEQKLRKALMDVGLEGLAVMQMDTFRPITGEPDRRIWLHSHGLFKATGSGFKRRECEEELNARRTFTNALGAKPVRIKRVSLYERSFAHLGGYFAAHPHDAKNPVPSLKRPGKFKLYGTQVGFAPSTCLRMGELSAHMTPNDIVSGVGDYGTALAAEFRRELRVKLSERRGRREPIELPFGDDPGEWFRQMRVRNGSRRLLQPYVRTQSNRRFLDGE